MRKRCPDLGTGRLYFIFFLTCHVSEGPKSTKPPAVQGWLQGQSELFLGLGFISVFCALVAPVGS